jgi:dihydroxyacetone kinase
MLAQLLDLSDKDRAFCKITKTDKTVLMVNNLGGVSPLELGGITTEVSNQLETDYGMKPVRTLAGTFMTSLNGLGFSITLLKVTADVLKLLDAPVETVGWNNAIKTTTWNTAKIDHQNDDYVPDKLPDACNIKSKLITIKIFY